MAAKEPSVKCFRTKRPRRFVSRRPSAAGGSARTTGHTHRQPSETGSPERWEACDALRRDFGCDQPHGSSTGPASETLYHTVWLLLIVTIAPQRIDATRSVAVSLEMVAGDADAKPLSCRLTLEWAAQISLPLRPVRTAPASSPLRGPAVLKASRLYPTVKPASRELRTTLSARSAATADRYSRAPVAGGSARRGDDAIPPEFHAPAGRRSRREP